MKVALDLLRRFSGPLVLASIAVLAVCIAGLGWRSYTGEREAREAARAKGAVITSRAGQTATAAALEATAGYGERELGRAALEQETRDAVLSAPDAKTDAGAAGDAGLAGLCRRAAYRDHPRCAGLRGADPAPAAR
ncbi:MAG TPA: hypothetical protein VEA44_08055 [Caulobacter sp.]|nr:hypothetical protein [Caulobacter sp.]